MDRFFSKLDLRDIKIDPHSTSFPPDDDTVDDEDAVTEDVRGDTVADAASNPEADDTGWVQEPEFDPAWSPGDQLSDDRANGVAFVSPAVDSPANQALAGSMHGEVLKVSARSRPSAVAGAIAGVVREAGRAEVQAIGAGATNQAVKAVAIARDYLRETGIEAVCLPAFIDVTIDNEERTAIRLVVEPR